MSADDASAAPPSSLPEFILEKGRYRLYVASACPFSHRVRLLRSLQEGLEDVMDITWVTHKVKKEDGWSFQEPEPEFGAKSMRELYEHAAPSGYKGSFSVPMILDRTTGKMVSNESLDSAFALAKLHHDDNNNTTLLPEGAEELVKELSDTITMGPYKFLMGGKKPEAAEAYWAELDKYEALLTADQPYLLGDHISVADCILWSTLVRHENVYVRQFHLPGKNLQADYPNLTAYIKRIWSTPSKIASGKETLGEEAKVQDIMRMYWQAESIAELAGNDPKSEVPEMTPLF